ncbi:MAG: anhydro-N-acetylmuramic acid kinase [Bacillota bacterium]
MNQRAVLGVGLISGTSADGIDAALVSMVSRPGEPVEFRLVHHLVQPYPPRVRQRVFALFSPDTARIDELCHLNFLLGELFAAAALAVIADAGHRPEEVAFVASHGQTVHHLPQPRPDEGYLIRSTLQIGEPAIIAERTGITTVADFRPRDIAAGGQGAPLVPLADYLLFGHPRLGKAVQNIGGIANVTYLPPNASPDQVVAFDSGPGNMIIDALVELATDGCLTYDCGGQLARGGRIVPELLQALLAHPFLAQKPPKSTGREEFGRQFAGELWRTYSQLAPADLVATATAFTVESIIQAYQRFILPWGRLDEIILGGGGSHNPVIVERLRAGLHPVRVASHLDYGIDDDAKEAMAFAILGYRTLLGQAGNLPSATGARRGVPLGTIIPGRPTGH